MLEKEKMCELNRTTNYIDDLPEIANSGLVLYELKTKLHVCLGCNDYTEYKGKKYCLQHKDG